MQKEHSMVNSPYPWWAPFPMCALNKKGMSLSKQISHTQIYYRPSLRPFENQLQFIFSTRIIFGNLAQPADPYHKCQHVHQLRSAAQDVSPTVLCSDVFQNTRSSGEYSNFETLSRIAESSSIRPLNNLFQFNYVVNTTREKYFIC